MSTQTVRKTKKRKSIKCGRDSSKYLIRIYWNEGCSTNGHKSFAYYTDANMLNQEKALEQLERRVVRGTAQGKFYKAVLVRCDTDSILKYFCANSGVWMWPADWKAQQEKESKQEHSNKCLLKAQVILSDYEFKAELRKMGMPTAPVIWSQDVDTETGETGYNVALAFLRQAIDKNYAGKYYKCNIWQQSPNKKVAELDHNGYTILDQEFKTLIHHKTIHREPITDRQPSINVQSSHHQSD